MVELRPEVLWFAEHMELKLRANEHKGKWNNTLTEDLFERLEQESAELYAEIVWHESKHREEGPERILSEAVDVANFAMMIADVCREQKDDSI